MAITGADVECSYGWEDVAFGTETANFDKAFGYDIRASTTRNNSRIDVGALGTQDPQRQLPGIFEGTLSLDFVCADFYWLRLLTGSVADAGAGPTWTHTYTYANTPISSSVNLSYDLSTDSSQSLLGCFANTATLTANVGEAIRGTIDFAYVNESEDAVLEPNVLPSEDPFIYAHASLEVPVATAITPVTSFTMTFNRNPERVGTLGSRITSERVYGMRNIQFSITAPFEAAADFLEKVYGSATGPSSTTVAEVADAKLNITNGLAGANERTLEITVTDLFPDTETMTTNPNEIISEEITMMGRGLTGAVYTNATAVAP